MPTKNNPRTLWKPKLPEVAEQCASCPFRITNNEEFGRVARWLFDIKHPTPQLLARIRKNVMDDLVAKHSGDFSCHCTVFDKNGEPTKPKGEWRQCSGAAEFYRKSV